eukprot:Sdes_comp21805_c0_seq1m20369
MSLPRNSTHIEPEDDLERLAKQLDMREEKHAAAIASRLETPTVANVSNSHLKSPKAGEKSSKAKGLVKPATNSVAGAPTASENSPAPISKSELRKQRRELQEKQRAEKNLLREANSGSNSSSAKKEMKKETLKENSASVVNEPNPVNKSNSAKIRVYTNTNASFATVGFFSHLNSYQKPEMMTTSTTANIVNSRKNIHPCILQLGLKYANGVIVGSNMRCYYLLKALRRVVEDYSNKAATDLHRDFEKRLNPEINFLAMCRVLGVSMGNIISEFKMQISKLHEATTEVELRDGLIQWIDNFIKTRITLADQVIIKHVIDKVHDHDVILIYASSSVVERSLVEAYNAGKRFRVVVLDSRPRLEGANVVKRLTKHGLECSYLLISAASYIMKDITKVFLGAHAFMANGYLMSRVGSSLVAMVAKSRGVPVLVCCETYKFCGRVVTDSVVLNELGDPETLVPSENQDDAFYSAYYSSDNLRILNILYDFTEPKFIDAVVTEVGIIPCTSVPVVIREYSSHLLS